MYCAMYLHGRIVNSRLNCFSWYLENDLSWRQMWHHQFDKQRKYSLKYQHLGIYHEDWLTELIDLRILYNFAISNDLALGRSWLNHPLMSFLVSAGCCDYFNYFSRTWSFHQPCSFGLYLMLFMMYAVFVCHILYVVLFFTILVTIV